MNNKKNLDCNFCFNLLNIIFLDFTDSYNIDQVQKIIIWCTANPENSITVDVVNSEQRIVEYLLRIDSDAATNKNGVGENSLVKNLLATQESTVSQNIQKSQSSSQTNEIPAEGRILKGIQNNSVE